MDDVRYRAVDAQMVDVIRKIRHERGACSMRTVASVMKLPLVTVSARCHSLRTRGLVTFSKTAGSLAVPDGVRTNGKIVHQQPALALPHVERFPWQQDIIDLVIGQAMERTVPDAAFIEMLLAYVPALRPVAAVVAEVRQTPPPEQLPLSTLDEALRLEALGASTEIDDVTIARLKAEAEDLPHTTRSRLAAGKAANKAAKHPAPSVASRTKPAAVKLKAQRTPAQEQADKDRMAKLRAARKPR